MHKRLSRKYVCRLGRPWINQIDVRIFRLTYFGACMQCNFCNDMCCDSGVDVDVENVARLKRHARKLARLVSVPEQEWLHDKLIRTRDYPGGAYTRTRVADGYCVFLNRAGRGCLLHQYALEQGIDYHDIKPMICSIFPLTFGDGLLLPAEEVTEPNLACLGPGQTLYEAVRDDLAYYFGPEFIAEVDEAQRVSLHRSRVRAARQARGQRIGLPLVQPHSA